MRNLLVVVAAFSLCLVFGQGVQAADYSGFALSPGESLVAVNGVPFCQNGQCAYRTSTSRVFSTVVPVRGYNPVPNAVFPNRPRLFPNRRPIFDRRDQTRIYWIR